MVALQQVAQAVIDGLSIGSTYALLALGLSLVFSVMGLINFAYGSLIVWAGYTISVADGLGAPYPVALAAMTVMTVGLSFLMGRIAFRPFQGAPPVTLLLTSFGVALALQALVIFIFGDAPTPVRSPAVLATSISLGGLRMSVLQILALGLAVAVFVLLNLLLNRTTFGLQIRAAAEDGETARLMGVRSSNVILYVFLISGFVAAVVAVIWFARVGTVDPRSDLTPTLKAFIAIVLGGLGSVRGAIIGGLVLGLLEAFLSTFLQADLLRFQQALAFVLLILILLLRPQGLAGRRSEVTK